MKAKLAMVLVVLATVLAWAGPAGADPAGLTNAASTTTTQGHPVGRSLAFAAPVLVNQEAVTATNTATAVAHDCRGCNAEAVAFQVVLASNTSTYVLTNNATSMNTNCETCTAVSVAEQWVVGDTNGRVFITPQGQFALAIIHLKLAILEFQDPLRALPQILALADQVSNVLSNDVIDIPNPTPKALAVPTVSPLAAPAPVPSGPTIQHNVQVSQ